MLSTVASTILGLPGWVALLVVFLLPMLESSAFIGFVFPGEIALILGGVLAFEGVVPLWAVLLAGIVGAVIGDTIGYAVGRRYGRRMIHGTVGRWIKHEHLDRGERYLAERGGKAVFVGRYTAALRVMIPGLAGMSRMPYRVFAGYNVAGGVSWATLCVLLGYLGGSSWRRLEHLATRISLGVLGLVALLVLVVLLVRRTRAGRGSQRLQRVSETRPARWVLQRFPHQVAWVGRRFEPGSWTGLPLTLLVVVGVGAVWTLLGITQDVAAHEELARLDPRVHAWVIAHRTGWLDPIMQAATWLGANGVLLPVLAVTACTVAWRRRSWVPVLDVVIVYGWAVIAYNILKDALHRPRPPATDWLMQASGFAYPSGHTTQATAAWGIICVLACAGRSTRTRTLLASSAAVIVMLVAFSRVYLGVHWFTDVLGGICLGVAILALWGMARITVLFTPPRPLGARSGAQGGPGQVSEGDT